MDKKITEIRDRFIEAVGNMGESIGLNRTVCQIYALLYISPDPLSPADIGRLLAVSKGNVSINMKKLEEWNAVKKVWRKGYARSLYRANDDIESIVVDKLKTGIEKRASLMKNTIAELKTSIKSISSGKGDMKIRSHYSSSFSRMENLLKLTDLFSENIDLLKSLLKK
ncbi:MAG TPA: hypothetical protein PKN36_08130 [bacterium]|nr:hypothetical protein [bacterium]